VGHTAAPLFGNLRFKISASALLLVPASRIIWLRCWTLAAHSILAAEVVLDVCWGGASAAAVENHVQMPAKQQPPRE